MKKTHAVVRAESLGKAVQGIENSDNAEKKMPVAMLNLSPDRIMDGISTKTEVLSKILESGEHINRTRHWGINE